jgi:hypothetical protein
VSDSAVGAVRAYLVDELRPMLPDTWDIKPGESTPATLAKPTLYMDFGGIVPLSAAPMGAVQVNFTLTIADHHADVAMAEDGVDEQIFDLISALDAHPTILWTDAKKIRIPQNNALAWQIDINTTVKKKAEARS